MASAGTEAGARPLFQMLITDLVAVRHPSANEVVGPGGTDWGIDTYVGRLDEVIAAWQSKFFVDWTGEGQRKQVRESFDQIVKKARENGFKIDLWTLCVPCVLPPSEQQWFDNWAKRQQRDGNARRVTLWNGVQLRRFLIQPDASTVLESYFGGSAPEKPAERVAICARPLEFDGALFVRQLNEAGHVENDAARGLFFAAEALVRDLTAREDEAGIAALDELHLEVQSIWEGRFNAKLEGARPDGRIIGLVGEVMEAAAAFPDPDNINLRPAHRRGVAHRLVENARAGWVSHWRKIAADHNGESAADIAGRHLTDDTYAPEAAQ